MRVNQQGSLLHFSGQKGAATACLMLAALFLPQAPLHAGTNWTLVGWNDLGMHCMDGTDFSVFSILPPYNTFHAHLVRDGVIITNQPWLSITYEAIADPDGSFNRTTADKVNFWDYADDHFGIIFPPGFVLPPDVGLAGMAMPGAANIPQPMTFEESHKWFTGEGVPISPFDDAGNLNAYPLMKLVASSNGQELASTRIVLPVSNEMDCSACHQSGSDAAAQPLVGWLWDCDPDRDMKLNILRLHDQEQADNPLYATALTTNHYNPNGLYATVTLDGTSILCARCHKSNALPVPAVPGIKPLTAALHGHHASVLDPVSGQPLESGVSREACYRCHPGTVTRCLRGAMGRSITEEGTLAIQCQSCHGSMADVGSPLREGWFDQPNCQACHVGTADAVTGPLRYDSAFNGDGAVRTPSNTVFATNLDTPLPGTSLYRFSSGHGGLQCSACHGSPHAIFPTGRKNDNLQSMDNQGHVGTLVECGVCHDQNPTTWLGGPHGMHRLGDAWVDDEHGDEQDHHKAASDGGRQQCQACHGTDYRGTVLSRMHADRTLNTGRYGTKHFWKGFQVGCYNCHRGPSSDDHNPNQPAVVFNASAVTEANTPVGIQLSATDADDSDGSLVLRIVDFPEHGAIGLSGTNVTYLPSPNFIGSDTFTFAAWDGDTDSNLATGNIDIVEGICVLSCGTAAPMTAGVGVAVPFWSEAGLDNCDGTVSYDWDFDDAGSHAFEANTCHTFADPGTFSWKLVTTANGIACTNSGVLTITADIVDTDFDGIEDDWELLHFSSLTNVNASSDYDMDGFLDLHEFLAGTQPTNDLSYLHLAGVATPSAGGVVIQWTSESGRSYRISRSTNLGPGIFNELASHLQATPPMNTYTDLNAIVEWLAMYRVEVEP